ncbi:hypothetical protein HanXRQr2_Chr13g0618271 [Helianthus annuus]|uniref:Uncharacterized protein n=1 Tax=Helianthus annuus TaxID=4232 RepID=A0A9K3EN35_HELAN|nr:hypothetical protein HanXRQr2_Chr13g0618271 [Helianthus annuus]
MLETVEPLFNRFFGYFFLRSISKQILDMGECALQFIELRINFLRASKFLEGFIS